MSDQSQGHIPPVPRYGEYATPPTSAYADVRPGMPTPGTPRRFRTWDLVLTIILLVLAAFGLLLGLFYAVTFDLVMQTVYDTGGLGAYSGGTIPGTVIATSHLVLFAIATGVSIPLLLKNKIAFWIPLTAGIIAACFFWGAVVFAVAEQINILTNYNYSSL